MSQETDMYVVQLKRELRTLQAKVNQERVAMSLARFKTEKKVHTKRINGLNADITALRKRIDGIE